MLTVNVLDCRMISFINNGFCQVWFFKHDRFLYYFVIKYINLHLFLLLCYSFTVSIKSSQILYQCELKSFTNSNVFYCCTYQIFYFNDQNSLVSEESLLKGLV